MRKYIHAFLLAAILFSALGVRSAAAQEGKGSIAGTVKDSSAGALKGALVELQPTGKRAVSDDQGQFRITDVAAGEYTLTVSYVGLTNFTKAVVVNAGQAVSADAVLNVASVTEQIVVSAERVQGEAEAINVERTADNIVQVLPAEVIRSLPNANMADALGRLPGVTIERDEGEGKYVQVRGTEPRLTNTTIDGVNVPSPESGVRQIKFDAIPADIVESVEINKTLQANMDGDGIGGSINLLTKTATDQPTISLSSTGGYTPILNGRGLVETTGTVGQRFGASKRFGALIGGSYDWNGRGIDDVEPVPDIANFGTPSQARYFDSADIREYRYYRSRWALAGSMDYKLGEDSNIYIRGLYSDFKNNGDRWVYSINDNTPFFNPFEPNQFPNAPTFAGSNGCSIDMNQTLPNGDPNPDYHSESCGSGTPSFNTQLRRPDYVISSIAVGGKHDLTTSWYTWELSVARSSQTGQVGDKNASYAATNLSSSQCEFSPAGTTNLYEPQWTPSCFTEAYNPANYTLSDLNENFGLSAQLNLQGSAAMGKRYHFGSHPATFEFGGKFRNAHKFDDTYQVDYAPNSGVAIPMTRSVFSNNNYYGGAYKLGPNPAFQDAFNVVQNDLSDFTVTSDASGNSANYDLVEKVSAGYLMNTIDFNKFRVVAGVRFEGTNLDTDTFLTTTTCNVPLVNDACPSGETSSASGFVKASGSYVTVLPSVAIRYAITNSTDVRVSYSRGISRPDPQDIAQAGTIDRSASPVSITLGNPNLKAEMADNFDVLFEHYLNPFGMFSAGYFYKNLTDPIITNQTPVIAGVTTTQTFNAGSAWLNGFEAAYLQHLSFLPGMLGGLGISANYGYTASRVSGLPGRSDHPRLLRNAPNSWNLSPTYDRGRISIRVGLSYNQANINSYSFQGGATGGLSGPLGDNYFYSHLQADAQGSIALAHGFSYVMYGLNLTNEVFGFYNGSTQYVVQREFYRPTIAVGLRWSPVREAKNNKAP